MAKGQTGKAGKAAGGVDEGLGLAVRQGVGRMYRRFRTMRRTGDLGDAAMEVLALLARGGPSTLTDLSREQQVRLPTMSQVVDRLAAEGYAERSRDPEDGRRVVISATPAGAKLVADLRAEGVEWLDAKLASLDEDDRRVLARAARLLREMAEDQGPD